MGRKHRAGFEKKNCQQQINIVPLMYVARNINNMMQR